MEFLFVVFLPVIIYSIGKEKNIYNPTVVFTTMWVIISFLSSLCLYGLNKTSARAYFLAFVGVLSFDVGCLMRTKIRIKVKKIAGINRGDDYEVRYGLLIIMYLIAIAFSFVLARRSINLLMHGTPMSVIRNNYRNIEAGLIVDSKLTYYVEQYFVAAAEFAAVALFPIILFAKKNIKKFILIIEIVLFLILHLFVTGARSFMIDVVLGVVLYALMNRQLNRQFKEYFSKIPKSVIVLVGVGAAFMVVYMSRLRKGDEISMIREMYMYFSISFPLFDIHLNMMALTPTYTYGMTMLNGLFRPLQLLLSSIGIPTLPLYRRASQMLGANNDYFYVGQTRANSFVTAFFNFYMDFGAVGIILGCFLWGYLSQSVYQNLKLNPNRRIQAIYILIVMGLFLSFAKLQFTAYRYLYAFLILLLAFSENRDKAVNV